MIVRFDKDLTRQDIYANGSELATIMGHDKDKQGKRVYTWPKEKEQFVTSFKNPVLFTDNHKIGQLEPSLRDTVFAIYNSNTPTITEYNGVKLEFDGKKYKGVWGVTIDTLLFCNALNKLDISNVKTAIELGCGSGYISKYVLEKTSPNLERITLVDFNEYAKYCVKDNIQDKRAEFIEGDAIKFLNLKNQQYDLVICNPPYIRRPKSIDDNAFEGIGLLANLIKLAPEIIAENGRFVTNISSLSGDIADNIIAKTNITDQVIDEMDVPLKVYNVLNNKVWMDYLLEHGLEKNTHDGYDYWQQIAIHEIKPGK